MRLTSDTKSEIISWVKTIVFAMVFALFITRVVIVNATIPTGSMEDTIMPNDRIVAFRLAYITSEPERFDVVVFKYPDDEKVLFVSKAWTSTRSRAFFTSTGPMVAAFGGTLAIYPDWPNTPCSEFCATVSGCSVTTFAG